ncbi:F-type H+-transporting ATPase subunit b [Bowdeniella nasicola]|uniref:ATP synthase subunit b n=1 Tax=Bowdeniella nasicola TaxID=208480 RepID=A0A1H3VQQ0_9ACTO|nr:F0F1 ATP synthase subunit B [Bowdeniella nasicola]SDZ77127.1 F-type H+-transporting ATPase subunit b [Bowdeniella nasicola]
MHIYAAGVPSNVLIPPLYDIFWAAVCVGIIAIVFWKSLPKIYAILDERAEKIEGGLKHAENVQAEADELRAELNQRLAEARKDAARIREEASEEGREIVAAARKEAQSEVERMHEVAKRQIEAERQAAQIALRADVGMLATELASKIVGESLTDQALQSRVIDRFLDDLEQHSPAPVKES